jgi:hypothetical protein
MKRISQPPVDIVIVVAWPHAGQVIVDSVMIVGIRRSCPSSVDSGLDRFYRLARHNSGRRSLPAHARATTLVASTSSSRNRRSRSRRRSHSPA